jgi:zinc protease
MTLDRSRRPHPQPSAGLTLPAIEKTVLRNGLRVWIVERHSLPSIACNLVLHAGGDHDPEGRAGLAGLTAELLDQGTASMSALEIADRLDFIGAAISIRAGLDATSAYLHTLTKHIDEALAVFGEIIAAPTFPEADLERTRDERLTSLLQHRDRPSYAANVAFHRILYGTHPYGNDPNGSEASLRAMQRQEVLEFYRALYRPSLATLIVVGDVSPSSLLPRLERAFGGWHGEARADVDLPPVPALNERRVYLVDKPAAPQSEIRIGRPALARTTPDYFPVIVMNRILGGQFSSRINLNLRERNGYTYGAGSSFRFARQRGAFTVSGGFLAEKTDRAIVELLAELTRMQEQGLTQEELAFSIKGIAGAFSLTFETPLQIATALQTIVLYGLSDDYYSTYIERVESVTLSEVRRVAGLYLDATRMAVLVVGDIQRVRGNIEELNLGTIVVCDSDGLPIRGASGPLP